MIARAKFQGHCTSPGIERAGFVIPAGSRSLLLLSLLLLSSARDGARATSPPEKFSRYRVLSLADFPRGLHRGNFSGRCDLINTQLAPCFVREIFSRNLVTTNESETALFNARET